MHTKPILKYQNEGSKTPATCLVSSDYKALETASQPPSEKATNPILLAFRHPSIALPTHKSPDRCNSSPHRGILITAHPLQV
jgi:hypothetical protein